MANIILKDKNGNDAIFEGVNSVSFRTVGGGKVKFSEGVGEVEEIPVNSSFDNTGDGVAEVYQFAEVLPSRFTAGYGVNIDAVRDITDENGVHQEAGKDSHYMKYDEIDAGTGSLPYAHVYCHEDRKHYLHYTFYVSTDGIYELASHIRIKDAQLRGATYTVNKGKEYEHAFVTTYGWESDEAALELRNNLQGAYMSGMQVYLHRGMNTLDVTAAEGVTKNQHFRGFYFVKVAEIEHDPQSLTMDAAEVMGVGLAEGARLPDYYYVTVTFNNGAPRTSDGFCRVRTSNGHLMSIYTINTNGQMPREGDTVTLACKIGCVNSSVNGDLGKEARIFNAYIV